MPRGSAAGAGPASQSKGLGSGGAKGSSSSTPVLDRLRKRTTGSTKSTPTSTSAIPRQNTGGFLRMYTEDAPGLKIGPTVALVLSLSFIGFVILLHIWGKFTR